MKYNPPHSLRTEPTHRRNPMECSCLLLPKLWLERVGGQGLQESSYRWRQYNFKWMANASWKILSFLVNQILQQTIRGRFLTFWEVASFHEHCQASIMWGPSHLCVMLRVVVIWVHTWPATGQWRNKWSISFEISLQRQHWDGPWNARRIRLTSVGTLFNSIYHINNWVLWGVVSFHIERYQQLTSIRSWAFIRAAYPSFYPYDFIFLWSNPDIFFLQCTNKSIPYPSPST